MPEMVQHLHPGMLATRIRRYAVEIEVDSEMTRFHGEVTAYCEFDSLTSVLELHSVDLEILGCVDSEGGDMSFELDPDNQIVSLALPDSVAAESFTVQFAGRLNDGMVGLYRSRLGDGACAVTQFEEEDARRAFPCIDHPGRKAVFEITLIAPEGTSALSNTPTAKVTDLDRGRRRYLFEPTPIMSTYLLFFGIGAFGYVDDQSARVTLRIVGAPDRVAAGTDSLVWARRSLAFLEAYTGIDYPLAKLDLIGVPDFAFGAMENYGAITFRENYLYRDPFSSSQSDVERMAGITAHEVAHMWFGNYVSPAEWRYVWLNEAFATYFQAIMIDSAYPAWRELEQFVDAKQTAIERDSLSGSIPIEIEKGEAADIDPSTAPIVYTKAGAVLHMMRSYLGPNPFALAIRTFLNRFAFSNATTDDFLDAFASGAGGSASQMLAAWIRSAGVPVIRAERQGEDLALTCERFLYLDDTGVSGRPVPWEVPISLVTYDADGVAKASSHMCRQTATIELPPGIRCYQINSGQSGYYRSAYDDDSLDALIESRALLSEIDRSGLICDLGALHVAGEIETSSVLAMVARLLTGETDELPVKASIEILGRCVNLLPIHRDTAMRLIVRSLREVVSKIELDAQLEEPSATTRMRNQAIWWLLRDNDVDVTRHVDALIEAYLGGTQVDVNSVPLILRGAALKGFIDEKWFTTKIEDGATSETLRRHLLSAIGWSSDLERLDRVLNYVSDRIPDRNRPLAVAAIAANPVAAPLLLPWLRRSTDAFASMHSYTFASIVAAALPPAGVGRVTETVSFAEEFIRPRKIDGPLDMALQWLAVRDSFVSRNGGDESARS